MSCHASSDPANIGVPELPPVVVSTTPRRPVPEKLVLPEYCPNSGV
jgi:hypothetical protein